MDAGLQFSLSKDWAKVPKHIKYRSVADVAVDSRDRIHLFARNDHQVIVLERDGSFVTAWGEKQFRGRPHGIAIGPDDSVYCADDNDHTVHKFSPTGKLLLTLGTSGVPSDTGYDRHRKTQLERDASITRSAPPFNRPTRVAAARSGDIYVADGYGNSRIHRFSAEGKLIQSWGEPGSGPGQFLVPHGIWIGMDGRIFVADRDNNRIQIFSQDGKYLEEWAGLSRPTSLFMDRSGLAYITEVGWCYESSAVAPVDDTLPVRFSVLDQNGGVVARWESAEGGPFGQFPSLHGVCVDSHGDLYLATANMNSLKYVSAGQDGESSGNANAIRKFVRVQRVPTTRGANELVA